VGECEGRGTDRGVVLVGLDVAHELAIELQRLDGQTLEVGQRGMAGPEIVDCQRNPEVAQGLRGLDRARRIAHRDRFGDLELQLVVVQLITPQHGGDLLQECGVAQLMGREVYRDAPRSDARGLPFG